MPKSDVAIDQRKLPLQGRSVDTCAVILEAAATIIASKGLAALNTNLVAARAGVSVGSLYQYFPGKEAILAALIRKLRCAMLDNIEKAVAQGKNSGLPDAIRALVKASLHHHVAHPALTEALELAEDELPMNAETQALKHRMGELVVDVLQQHGVSNPQQMAFDLIAMSHGIVAASTRTGEADLEDLTQRVLRAVFGYLGLSGSEAVK